MNQTLDRREMLRQTAAGLTSSFCVGRLQYDPAKVCDQADLQLAAATSLEFWIQNLMIPYGIAVGRFELSPQARAKGHEVSKWLNPDNAPPIFEAAQIVPVASDIVVRFSETVAISLSQRAIAQMRRSLNRHPNVGCDVSAFDDEQIVETVVRSFTIPGNWKYD